MFETKQKSIELKQTCSTCGKPVGKGSITGWITGSSDIQSLYDRWGCSCDSQASVNEKLQDELAKQSFGNWKLKSKIGDGYLGSVYLAESSDGEKKAAVRIFNPILSLNRRIAKRFLQEAEKATTLTHRNIAMVYEHGTLPDGNVYMISEYVEGVSLQEKLKTEGFFDVPETLNIVAQICEALEEAHKQGILHRSVKPSTIIIQPSGSIKLIDFGIEKAIPTNGKDTQCLSQVSAELGNPRYMSLEQCLGESLNEKSDLYSIGCVMYEMLTGKIIFEEHKGFMVALAQLREVPLPFSKVMYNSDIPAEVEAVVLRTLEKSPDDRYTSVKQLREDIEAINSGATPPTASQPIVRATEQPTYPVKPKKQIAVAITFMLAILFTLSFVFAAVSFILLRFFSAGSLPNEAQTRAEERSAAIVKQMNELNSRSSSDRKRHAYSTYEDFNSNPAPSSSQGHRRAFSTYDSYYGSEPTATPTTAPAKSVEKKRPVIRTHKSKESEQWQKFSDRFEN